MNGTEHIKSKVERGVGEITLNRPEALNALTLEMIVEMDKCLEAFAEDKSVRIVLVTSNSDKAFCAGGDIKAVAKAAKELQEGTGDGELCNKLFRAEYQLNARIQHLQKPYISFIDGICMGGGMGISVHGSHRIVTERARFAMPEVNIGFFPDVGSGFALNRLPGEIGTWLAMTGSSISGGDMLKCKLATHFIDVDGIEPLLDNLRTADWQRADGTSIINAILANYCEENIDVHSDLEPMFSDIDRVFKGDTVDEIFRNLEAEGGDWAQDTLKQLRQACPISVVIALAHIRASQDKDFDDVMAAEYKLSRFFMEHPDFYEGVRAALIDKDHAPQWSSAYKDLESFAYQYILDSYEDWNLAL